MRLSQLRKRAVVLCGLVVFQGVTIAATEVQTAIDRAAKLLGDARKAARGKSARTILEEASKYLKRAKNTAGQHGAEGANDDIERVKKLLADRTSDIAAEKAAAVSQNVSQATSMLERAVIPVPSYPDLSGHWEGTFSVADPGNVGYSNRRIVQKAILDLQQRGSYVSGMLALPERQPVPMSEAVDGTVCGPSLGLRWGSLQYDVQVLSHDRLRGFSNGASAVIELTRGRR